MMPENSFLFNVHGFGRVSSHASFRWHPKKMDVKIKREEQKFLLKVIFVAIFHVIQDFDFAELVQLPHIQMNEDVASSQNSFSFYMND